MTGHLRPWRTVYLVVLTVIAWTQAGPLAAGLLFLATCDITIRK